MNRQKYQTAVTLVLRTTQEIETDLFTMIPWWRSLFADSDSFYEWIAEAKARFEPTLDLLERVIPNFLHNAMTTRVLNTRVSFARDASFQDAFSFSDKLSASASLTVNSPITNAETCLADRNFVGSLENCLMVCPLPEDPTRKERLEAAVRSGQLRDRAGLLGKEEVLRDIQLGQVMTVGHPLAVVFLDMNGLKQINDNQGHEAGDQAIAGFQKLLLKHSENGAAYRDGGDEFILLYRVDQDGAITRVRNFLRDVMSSTDLSASGGIAFTATSSEAPEDVKKRADSAMYVAKKATKEAHQSGARRPCAFSVEGGEVEWIRAVGQR